MARIWTIWPGWLTVVYFNNDNGGPVRSVGALNPTKFSKVQYRTFQTAFIKYSNCSFIRKFFLVLSRVWKIQKCSFNFSKYISHMEFVLLQISFTKKTNMFLLQWFDNFMSDNFTYFGPVNHRTMAQIKWPAEILDGILKQYFRLNSFSTLN